MAEGTRMQQRRATASVWDLSSYVLAAGEIGVATDTKILKVGDGVNTWANLSVAFAGYYLSASDKAADSELLDGIDSSGFFKTSDGTTAATANKVAVRSAAGRLKAVAGASGDDLVTYDQMNTADVVNRRLGIIRSVSDAVTSVTLAATDVGSMVAIANSSLTQQRPIALPTNSADPIAIGSWIDVCSANVGNLKIGGVGITVLGGPNVFGNFSIVRLIKNATDSWIVSHLSNQRQCKLPRIRVYKSSGTTAWAANVDKALDFNTVDTTQTFNPDDEWFALPAAGLATDKRIIILKDGVYAVTANWNGTSANQNYIKICKMSGTAVVGQQLAHAPTFVTGTVSLPAYRFAANESVGAVFFTGGATDTGKADTAGAPHDLSITRIGD